MQQYKAKKLGFTLIELLLVISILGVMASLGLAFLQKRAEQAKIDRAALQMQQLFEAGMAYNNDNNSWPSSSEVNSPPFIPYIPLGATMTPWGGDYSYTPVHITTSTQKFRVCTPRLEHKLALRLKNMLPSAALFSSTDACDTDSTATPCEDSDASCGVVASDVVQSEGGGDILLVKSGNIHFAAADFNAAGIGEKSIDSFVCPESWEHKISTSVNSFAVGSMTFTAVRLLKKIQVSDLCDDGNCAITVRFQQRACSKYKKDKITCKSWHLISAAANGSNDDHDGAGSVDIGYFAYCQKPVAHF